MNRQYQTVITDVGAHMIDQRAHHEIDRANQRLVIVCMVLIATVWRGFSTQHRNPVVDALAFIAAVYVALTLVYRTLIRTRPDAFVALQYGSIVLDPALTVLAIAAMPTVLGLVATSLCCWSKACRRTTAAHSTQHTAAEVGPSVLVSASVGVHCWAFANQPSANEIDLIEIADRAMYAAKRAGKSRVVLSAGQLVSD